MSRPDASEGRGLAALRTALIAALEHVRSAGTVLGPAGAVATGYGQLPLAGAFDVVLSTETRPTRPIKTTAGAVSGRPPSGAPPPDNGHAPDGDPETRRIVALVDLARAGDRAAFGQLYEKYVDTIYRFILYRVTDVALAEDLTQEVFTRALRKVYSFAWQGRDFGAWLITIAKNLITDHFKASRTRLESVSGELNEPGDIAGNPESIIVEEITAADLRALIKRLNPQQQECIELRFLHEFSVAETAVIMGKNEGAIKTLQYRAIRALLKLICEGGRAFR